MAALNVFDTLYFRSNKKLLRFVGLWPYDSRNKIIRVVWMMLLFILNAPHFIGMMIHIHDIDKLMEHFVIFYILIAAFMKHLTLVMAENKMGPVYNDIAKNWLMITDEEEKKILIDYSQRGRFLTEVYSGLMRFLGVSFMFLALVPEILNAISPLPTPRAHLFLLNGEFLVANKDDHFYKIYLWDMLSVFAIVSLAISVDPMYNTVVEHASALYAIVTYRLSKLRYRLDVSSALQKDTSHEWLQHAVELHQIVLSFTRNINDSYSTCFICLMLMNLVALPVTCVVVLIHLHNPMSLLRFALILIGLMMHLFVLFWPGQRLIDHSIKLVDDAYSNEWYETSARTKKLLRIFMIRCSQPCLITAGGLVEMNFVVYFKVVKTAASYITVLASFR